MLLSEMIAKLQEFPPDSMVILTCNYMQDAELLVYPPGNSPGITIMEA